MTIASRKHYHDDGFSIGETKKINKPADERLKGGST